ncbi:alpha 3 protein [Fox fecal rhabdovirus]|uniref:Alpha 3 protein n=1 Tax=Fox fecal rhabdovirus TaxID=1504569 RepID=A0A060D4P4_9RHAB|nr:alpha 3 protein [Fox fecal rhabdovirus]AIB06811.1 alpha 3 protein [Fox fecal rhabdovirus]
MSPQHGASALISGVDPDHFSLIIESYPILVGNYAATLILTVTLVLSFSLATIIFFFSSVNNLTDIRGVLIYHLGNEVSEFASHALAAVCSAQSTSARLTRELEQFRLSGQVTEVTPSSGATGELSIPQRYRMLLVEKDMLENEMFIAEHSLV